MFLLFWICSAHVEQNTAVNGRRGETKYTVSCELNHRADSKV